MRNINTEMLGALEAVFNEFSSDEIIHYDVMDKVVNAINKAKSKWTVYCSSCGHEFSLKQKTGFSHCEDHKGVISNGR